MSLNIRNMMIYVCIKYWVGIIPAITIITTGNIQLGPVVLFE